MKKKRFFPWVLATASALVAAGVIAQPVKTSRVEPYPQYTTCMATPKLISNTRKNLDMNDAQEALWEQARVDSQALRQTMLNNFATMQAAVAEELAHTAPDFTAIAGLEETTLQTNQALRRQMQNIWLQVYVVLSEEQQAMVRQAMLQQKPPTLERHRPFPGVDDLHALAPPGESRTPQRRDRPLVTMVSI